MNDEPVVRTVMAMNGKRRQIRNFAFTSETEATVLCSDRSTCRPHTTVPSHLNEHTSLTFSAYFSLFLKQVREYH